MDGGGKLKTSLICDASPGKANIVDGVVTGWSDATFAGSTNHGDKTAGDEGFEGDIFTLRTSSPYVLWTGTWLKGRFSRLTKGQDTGDTGQLKRSGIRN